VFYAEGFQGRREGLDFSREREGGYLQAKFKVCHSVWETLAALTSSMPGTGMHSYSHSSRKLLVKM